MEISDFKKFQVGTIVSLKVPLLNNPIGTLGVCYNIYDRPRLFPESKLDTIGKGYGFIFENGWYDGFSPYEVSYMLEFIKNTPLNYKFKSMIYLSEDFGKGCFVFEKNIIII